MNDHRGLKVLTVVGTRPEIIRLSETIKRLDEFTDHVLVHTGQNYDYELNEVFFEDLGLRRPDHFLEADTTSLGTVLGSILMKTETVLLDEKPDAMLVLGDTNSCISALMARRMKIPVYHMEAGNRCFDENVPEEVNRKMIDHVADYNLVYTEHARRNLLAEGIHPSRILLTGSPMREVLDSHAHTIAESDVLERQGLVEGEYFLVSLHREENVDNRERLSSVLSALNEISDEYGLPVLVSTHPRTRKRLDAIRVDDDQRVRFQVPFGFIDYVRLQLDALIVLSDSGTISEESSMLGFAAVTLRESTERPELQDAGGIVTAGVCGTGITEAVRFRLQQSNRKLDLPSEYAVADTSYRVLNTILSTARTHRSRVGIREKDEGD